MPPVYQAISGKDFSRSARNRTSGRFGKEAGDEFDAVSTAFGSRADERRADGGRADS
jgi:hypothetical protein